MSEPLNYSNSHFSGRAEFDAWFDALVEFTPRGCRVHTRQDLHRFSTVVCAVEIGAGDRMCVQYDVPGEAHHRGRGARIAARAAERLDYARAYAEDHTPYDPDVLVSWMRAGGVRIEVNKSWGSEMWMRFDRDRTIFLSPAAYGDLRTRREGPRYLWAPDWRSPGSRDPYGVVEYVV